MFWRLTLCRYFLFLTLKAIRYYCSGKEYKWMVQFPSAVTMLMTCRGSRFNLWRHVVYFSNLLFVWHYYLKKNLITAGYKIVNKLWKELNPAKNRTTSPHLAPTHLKNNIEIAEIVEMALKCLGRTVIRAATKRGQGGGAPQQNFWPPFPNPKATIGENIGKLPIARLLVNNLNWCEILRFAKLL